MGTTFALLVIGLVVKLEYDYRKQRDGKKDAVGALLFAAIVFVVGSIAQSAGGLAGLLWVAVALAILLGIVLLNNSRKAKKG